MGRRWNEIDFNAWVMLEIPGAHFNCEIRGFRLITKCGKRLRSLLITGSSTDEFIKFHTIKIHY